jgi:hypothetical protein
MVLLENKLYFSRPQDFNDPWDCKPFFNLTSFVGLKKFIIEKQIEFGPPMTRNERKKLEKLLHQKLSAMDLAKLSESLTGSIQAIIHKRYRVFCLTPNGNNELMWSHYAAQHRGIAIEFDSTQPLFIYALGVDYQEHYPVRDFSVDDGKEESLTLMLTKSLSWRYEEEYRLIGHEDPNIIDPILPRTRNGIIGFQGDLIKSVVLGIRAGSETKDAVAAMIKKAKSPIVLKQAIQSPNSYKIEFETIDLT